MATYTIEVTGISDELLRRLDERVRQRGGDRADFVRELIRRELQESPGPSGEAPEPHAELTFEEILRPVHQQVAESGTTEEELEEIFEEALTRVRAEKKATRARG